MGVGIISCMLTYKFIRDKKPYPTRGMRKHICFNLLTKEFIVLLLKNWRCINTYQKGSNLEAVKNNPVILLRNFKRNVTMEGKITDTLWQSWPVLCPIKMKNPFPHPVIHSWTNSWGIFIWNHLRHLITPLVRSFQEKDYVVGINGYG